MSIPRKGRITRNFTYEELTYSHTAKVSGIDNNPKEEFVWDNLEAVAKNILQPAREDIQAPITITSGHRGDELNLKIGGARDSQHSKGEAVDMTAKDSKVLFEAIRQRNNFDQLIWEYGDDEQPDWVHASYRRDGTNRGIALKAIKENGKTQYLPFS